MVARCPESRYRSILKIQTSKIRISSVQISKHVRILKQSGYWVSGYWIISILPMLRYPDFKAVRILSEATVGVSPFSFLRYPRVLIEMVMYLVQFLIFFEFYSNFKLESSKHSCLKLKIFEISSLKRFSFESKLVSSLGSNSNRIESQILKIFRVFSSFKLLSRVMHLLTGRT